MLSSMKVNTSIAKKYRKERTKFKKLNQCNTVKCKLNITICIAQNAQLKLPIGRLD